MHDSPRTIIRLHLTAHSPLAFRLSVFVKLLLPLSKRLVPRWLRRAVVRLFPTASTVNLLAEVVNTMHERSSAIYQETKLRVVGVDAEVVKQIDGRKDILSSLSELSKLYYSSIRVLDEQSSTR